MRKSFPEESLVSDKTRTTFAKFRQNANLTIAEAAVICGKSVSTIYRWERGEITAPKLAIMEMRDHPATRNTIQFPAKPSFRFIDLFAGIGGLRRGFETVGGQCVFTSEWDAPCRETYRHNFPDDDHDIEGDITQIEPDSIPEHDVLLAGFPCQPFSIAGVSKKNSLGRAHGFRDATQGTLFFNVATIIAHHNPPAFLLENVKNLVSHNKGHTFKVIREVLEKELGYHIDFRVINAKGFVPQNRQRIFIAGFRKDTGFDFSALEIPDPEDGPRMDMVLHPEDGTELAEEPFTLGALGKVNSKYTLSPKLWSYLQRYAEKHRARGNGFGFGLVGPDDVARTLSARYYKDGSEILVRQRGKRPRRLTPRECARLMGFDGPGESNFVIPVSDTQAYKQFGNSVVVPVVREVATFMLAHILDAMQHPRNQAELDFGFTEEHLQAASG